ncbi:hypothetical protein [Halalkalibaculum sp. DA3122]|uniref:hypothetical protein n=1 Tax=Halalkalibaculum sp. DA3122 TaxID=3373607 RepID=UPI00375454D0
MMDGVCMTSGSGGMAMHCDCHENNGNPPFYCSCDASGKQLISGVQISKVLLPSIAGADHTLDFTIHTDPATTFATQFCLKDIFHPPQFS